MASLSSPKLSPYRTYLLDSNVLISAWTTTHPVDSVPEFWNVLRDYAQQGIILSVDQVHGELSRKQDALFHWIQKNLSTAFRSTRTPEIAARFGRLQQYVNESTQYTHAAKNEFATIADGWLAAYALEQNCTLVTLEKHNPNKENKIPIPNLCERFGIACCDTTGMLNELQVKLEREWSNDRGLGL